MAKKHIPIEPTLGEHTADFLRRYLEATRPWVPVDEMCESPIEKALFVQLLTQGFRFGYEVMVGQEGRSPHFDDGGVAGGHAVHIGGYAPDALFVWPQVDVGKYRADFVVEHAFEYRGNREQRAVAAIECDGHDFHERTKQQAARDRKRDREFQRIGLPVLRFTGSEIWKDAARCAFEVIRHFNKYVSWED